MEFLKQFVRNNSKLFGVLVLIVLIMGVTGAVESSFLGLSNITNQLRWIGLFGILALGAGLVIISGGIDLSIGSLVGLMGCLFPIIIFWDGAPSGMSVGTAYAVVLVLSALIGLIHGLLITKLKLQPFVVTLCGLFIYRGAARAVANDKTVGFESSLDGLKATMVKMKLFGFLPMSFVVLLIIAVVMAILLNKTTYGRYLLALGRNEQAARFSGISTDRVTIITYVLCSVLAGFGATQFVLDVNTATPSKFGNFYELWAIAGAVLGGCSLRGGEGTIGGMIAGTALVRIAVPAAFFLGVENKYEFVLIGMLILIGVIVDEVLKRIGDRRRAMQHAG